MSAHGPMPRSAWLYPALAVLLFAAVTATGYSFAPSAPGWVFAIVLLVILFGTVFAAVHHAEMIAERIGEPFGTLLLTMAITIIEVALIATIMLGDKPAPAPLALMVLDYSRIGGLIPDNPADPSSRDLKDMVEKLGIVRFQVLADERGLGVWIDVEMK